MRGGKTVVVLSVVAAIALWKFYLANSQSVTADMPQKQKNQTKEKKSQPNASKNDTNNQNRKFQVSLDLQQVQSVHIAQEVYVDLDRIDFLPKHFRTLEPVAMYELPLLTNLKQGDMFSISYDEVEYQFIIQKSAVTGSEYVVHAKSILNDRYTSMIATKKGDFVRMTIVTDMDTVEIIAKGTLAVAFSTRSILNRRQKSSNDSIDPLDAFHDLLSFASP